METPFRASKAFLFFYKTRRSDKQKVHMNKRIVIAITGASGAVYGIRTLAVLRDMGVETHLIISDAGRITIGLETGRDVAEVESLASRVHQARDFAAPLASGSFLTDAMVVVPCTIKTLSAIANSYSDNLIARAADVHLKEKRRLVLVVRETPLSANHLRLMARAAEMGAQILPPMPAFYHRPATIEDIVVQTVGKILDSLSIAHDLFPRWGERP